MLLPSISQVTAGYQTTNMLTALPSSFLEPLLSFSLTEDPEVRLLVLQILLSLIDRHDNTPKFSNIRYVCVLYGKVMINVFCWLSTVLHWQFVAFVGFCSIISDISVLKLKVDKCSRQDNLFMKKVRFLHCKYMKIYMFYLNSRALPLSLLLITHHASSWQHGQQLYRHIYLGCKEQSSGQQHYETLFALLGLLSVELASEEVVVDLIRLTLALQVLMHVACYFYLYNCEICHFTTFTIFNADVSSCSGPGSVHRRGSARV